MSALCRCCVGTGIVSIYALMAIFFFESIMFPTILRWGKEPGQLYKEVLLYHHVNCGRRLLPYFMGWMADSFSTAVAYTIQCVVL
jgi:FHS family L-fucose permease-like MFS transporter